MQNGETTTQLIKVKVQKKRHCHQILVHVNLSDVVGQGDLISN